MTRIKASPWVAGAFTISVLAGCVGSSGSGIVPITLQGATIWQQTDDASTQVVRQIVGGDGGNFSGVIFIDDGFFEFLQEQTGAGTGETVFFRDGFNQARLFVPASDGSDDYESIRFLNLTYQAGFGTYNQFGYIGRATVADDMQRASGTATYQGNGTVDVFVLPPSGPRLDFPDGNAVIAADFGNGRVDVFLNGGPRNANWIGQPYDEFRITGMTIDESRFRGGTFSARKDGAPLPDFSTSDFQASGFFAGFNDGSGAVSSGDVPGEVGGAFRADSELDGVAIGVFAAD